MFLRFVFVCYFMTAFSMATAFAGKVELTTYYPAPYGEYKEIKTTENACFATDATKNGKVGIGTTTPVFNFHVQSSEIAKMILSGFGDDTTYSSMTLDSGDGDWLTNSWVVAFKKSRGLGIENSLVIGRQDGDVANPSKIYFMINPSGNVGIGTTNPQTKLNVFNDDQGQVLIAGTDRDNQTNSVLFLGDINNNPWVNSWFIVHRKKTGQPGENNLAIGIQRSFGNSADFLNIDDVTGNVGISNDNPAYKLDVAGQIHSSSPVWTSSDRRLKNKVTPLTGALAMVESLQGVSFEWKIADFPDRGFEKGRQIGLIAQDVEKIVPELVSTDHSSEGYKSVSYEKAVPILIEAIKEQQQQIDLLEKEVTALQGKKRVTA